MSTFNAGAIEASLALGRTSWTEDLKKTWAEIDRLEAKTITVGIDADDTNARIAMDNIELLLDDLGQQTYTPSVDLNTEPAEAAIARLEAQFAQIDTNDIMIGVDADTDNAWIKLDTLETFLTSMDANDINIKVNVDSAEAEVKLIGLAQFMQAISMNDINIDTNVHGYIDTMSKLAALEAQIIAVDHNDIDVKVNYDRNTLSNLIGGGAGAGATGGGQLGLLELAMILIIGLAPILGVAIGAASAAVIGFVAALVAAAGPLVVLGLGIFWLLKQYTAAKKAGTEMVGPMKEFADSIDHFKKVMADLPDFQKEGFGLLADVINLLSKIVPTLVPLFRAVATVIDDMVGSIDDWVGSQGYKSFLDFFSGFGIEMLKRFIQIFGNLLRFFGNLFVAFEPFTRVMMRGLAGVTKSWADWSAGLEHNKGFQHFIDNALHYGPMLLHMLGSLWGALQNIAHALEPFAGPMIVGLTHFFDLIANMDPHTLGLLAIGLSGMFVAMKVLIPGVSTLVGGISGLIEGAGILAEVLGVSVGVLAIWALAIAAAVGMFIYLWNTNKEFHDGLISTWHAIRDAIMPIVGDITQFIKDNWGGISDWASGVWHSVEEIIVSAFTIIERIIKGVLIVITFIWHHWGQELLQIAKGQFQIIGGFIKGAFQIIAGIFRFFADLLSGRWGKLWGDIKQIGHGAMTILESSVRGFGNIFAGVFKIIWSVVSGLWSRMWGNLKSQAADGWGHIKDGWNNFIGWLSGIPGRVGGAISGMWDGIISGFRNAINTVIGWWNSLSFSIPGFDPPGPGPKFGGFTIHPPAISPLAEGGWIDKPTLALIGEGSEPEIVSPESKMRKIFSEANHFDYGRMAQALTVALRPIFGAMITPDVLERLLRNAAPHVAVDASNDDRSAHAMAHEMAFQLRVLGYGGAA